MNFKKLLSQLKLKQNSIAKALDISQQLVSKWCKGKCEPSLNSIIKMSEIFGIPIADIVLSFKKD